MDYLGYLASNKFILIAADTRFQSTVGSTSIKTDRAHKVFQLSDHALLSVVGDLQKAVDIRTYMTEINRLRPNESFDELLEHLLSVFNLNPTLSTANLRAIQTLMRQYITDDNLDISGFAQALNDQPELVPFVTEALEMFEKGLRSPTIALLFGTEPDRGTLRLAKHYWVGDMFRGGDVLPMQPDVFAFEFISSTFSLEEQQQVNLAMGEQLHGSVVEGWEQSPNATSNLKDMAKHCLLEGMRRLNPYVEPLTEKDLVYYEISAETNWQIIEPTQSHDLIDVVVTRLNAPAL